MKLSEEWREERKHEMPAMTRQIGDDMADELDRLEKLTGLYRQFADHIDKRLDEEAYQVREQIKQMEETL